MLQSGLDLFARFLLSLSFRLVKSCIKKISMEKKLHILNAFTPSILFVIFGIYILKITNSILGTVIGFITILFFSLLIIWAIIKLYKNSYTNNQ